MTVGARTKEFTLELLEAANIPFIRLTKKRKGVVGLAFELLQQQVLLANLLRKNKFDVMLQIGGIFNAPIGRLFKIPTLAISDTENDRIGNMVSFSLSSHVLSPDCFDHEVGKRWKNQILYPGYHELAYLAPKYLSKEPKPSDKILVRFVGWSAGHDLEEKWLTNEQKITLIRLLERFGSVYISSEMELPQELRAQQCKIHPADMHDFMLDCKMVVGESATMASEAACLGIPAVFISNTGRGYTTEEDRKYGLVKHFTLKQWNEVLQTVKEWGEGDLRIDWQRKKDKMLEEKIDVTAWLVDFIESYPDGIERAKLNDFDRYRLKCVE